MKLKFFKSSACRNRSVCAICRDKERGRVHRKAWLENTDPESTDYDFICTKRRDWNSEGLGDTIAKLTKKAGFKQCGGCKKRQATLNKLIPYKK